MAASLKALKQNKPNLSDWFIRLLIIPVIIQAAIIVSITFYGFGRAALAYLL
jgi:hypothetical protein